MSDQPPHTGGVKTIDEVLQAVYNSGRMADKKLSETKPEDILPWLSVDQAKLNLQSIMQERLDQQHNELTDNERKVWLTTEQLEKRLQDYAMKYAEKVQGQKISNWTDVGGKVAFKNIPLTNHNANMWRRGYNAAVTEQRTANLTLEGKIDD